MTQRKLHLWCLIDARTKKMVEGLLFDEARAVVSSLESDVVEHWFAWRDDWIDWKRVTEVDGLTEMIYRQLDVAPPIPPSLEASSIGTFGPQGMSNLSLAPNPGEPEGVSMSLAGVKEAGSGLTTTSAQTQTGFTVRSKRRFKKRYQISVEIDGQTFTSYSRDISVGGISLEDAIPIWVQGYFKVRIGKTNSKNQIELKCSFIQKEGEDDRYRIKILPLQNAEDEQKLETWIAA